ncbi:MAG: DUF421 domain-containing protein [Bacteroidota bacterium]|nr:DUF421 domain-containing protein [Bacteroidota bacterium]
MFDNPYFHVVISSAAVYLFITVAIRIFGKKELAQLSVLDLVFVLLISNAVQNAMVGSDTTLQGGLLAAGTLFLLNYAFKHLLYRSGKLTRLLEGEPVILVSEGKVNDKNLRAVQITTNELLEVIREHGVESILDVNLAILEVDGNISIISHDFKKRSVKSVGKRNVRKILGAAKKNQ